MTDLKTLAERMHVIWGIGNSLQKRVVACCGSKPISPLEDPKAEDFGAEVGRRPADLCIRLQVGTYFYLLDEVRAAIHDAPVTEYAQGRMPSEGNAPGNHEELVDVFTSAIASVAFCILTTHELCHILNGHYFLKNPDESENKRLADEARRLRRDPAVSFALELNADLAGISCTLAGLGDPKVQIKPSLEFAAETLSGIATPAGIGSVVAFAVVVLAKTWQAGATRTSHPKPSFRFEALKRAVMWFWATQGKALELQSFQTMLPEAVRFLLPTLRPQHVEFSYSDALQNGYEEMPRQIEDAWRESEPFLQRQKTTPELCLDEEMHNWRKTLNW
jgi:hypothetical protein